MYQQQNMTKFVIFIGFAIAFQLMSNGIEYVAAQNYQVNSPINYPVNEQRRTTPIGGISVEHPLQATVYAFRRGKMKLLVPFEITVVPMGGLQAAAENPPAPNGYPFSGQIQPQQPSKVRPSIQPQQPVQQQQPGVVRYPSYNGVYGQQTGIYQGSQQYYPVSHSYQQPYNPYQSYYPNNLSNGYYNNQQPVQNSYYNQQPRREGFPQYRPQYQQPTRPQMRPQWTRQNATNVTPNWLQNNSAININDYLNNLKNSTHQLNATTSAPTSTPTPVSSTATTTTTTTPTTIATSTSTTTLNATTTPINLSKPTTTSKPTTMNTTAASNMNSTLSPESTATVKEILPKTKPNALLFAQLPAIDEIPNTEQDSGYFIPSNFAPQSPIPLNDESLGQTPIM